MNAGIARYVRTIRHLKPVQIYGRVQHHIARPRIVHGAAPALRLRPENWTAPIERGGVLTGPAAIRLLNHDGEVAKASHWNDPKQEKLWLYNLHYFDDLKAARNEVRQDWQSQLVTRWIAENPIGEGNGWEPYPLSLRIVNWLKWMLGGVEPRAEWVGSLAAQARFLSRRIERHLLGNHLLANAKALVFAGVCFCGDEADGWLRTGLDIYGRELDEQVLGDGGHFERSPMYHAIVLEDLLDVVNLLRAHDRAGEPVIKDVSSAIARMLKWLDVMVHPDGEIAFFNDAAIGVAAAPCAIRDYASRLEFAVAPGRRERMMPLAESGYMRIQTGPACAFLDVAPVGPDYLPGHAHADTLSFELSIGGQRVIVNGGTSLYGDCRQRHLERSTAAHSTVEVDGENSSEVWGSFRVGRRARVLDVRVRDEGTGLSLRAAHNGYSHLAGKPVHRRTWTIDETGLTVADQIDGSCREAVGRFHLGEGVIAKTHGKGGHLELPDGAQVTWTSSVPARVRASQWHPQFGVTVPTMMLEVALVDNGATVRFEWA
ncbi:MAG: heparinase II/III family protein [Hyphomicrobiales bacterium]|nr:heparinase II/III family protein [Hyphomicrobiales bacterium]